ncbi:MAG: M67 family metallopeptidase [Clostridiales Family XIII bacterium]|jgi:proteasome lid subunit RPN8/RPN11|nr:M67 family metallopeptidase [Clostridiales Family XIII bacterium]
MTRLSAEAEKLIREEGERAYPDECCGLLIGADGADGARSVSAALPVENARVEGERGRRFAIGPDDFMRGEAAARRMGMGVVGVYHSHPDHPETPSEYDRERALPYYSYIIVAVEKGRSAALGSFLLAPDRSGFLREPLETEA